MALVLYQSLFLLTFIHSVILPCIFYYVCMWAYIPWMLIYRNSLRTGLNVIFSQGLCHCFSLRISHLLTKIKLNYWFQFVETIKVYNSDINSQDGLPTFPPANTKAWDGKNLLISMLPSFTHTIQYMDKFDSSYLNSENVAFGGPTFI